MHFSAYICAITSASVSLLVILDMADNFILNAKQYTGVLYLPLFLIVELNHVHFHYT